MELTETSAVLTRLFFAVATQITADSCRFHLVIKHHILPVIKFRLGFLFKAEFSLARGDRHSIHGSDDSITCKFHQRDRQHGSSISGVSILETADKIHRKNIFDGAG
ncbi:MAG: hypothetical protein AAF827_01490 [Cyanobacteria bacterium P01_D01_bin.6]